MASEPRSAALAALTGLLGLHEDGSRSPTDAGQTLGVVGPTDSPRFLLPLDHRPATTAACTAYTKLRPVRTRASRRAISLAVSAGLEDRILSVRLHAATGPGSLLGHLAEVLDAPDIQVAIGVGNHDAVWKPTLQCFAPDGTPVAYVKIGLGPIGAHLVTTEREALAAWTEADDPRLVVPRLLASTAWEGSPIICTEPMPADVSRLPPGPMSPWAVRLLDPPLPDVPVSEAPWWTDRATRHANDPEVADLLDAIEHEHGQEPRAWARWHGDWVPWNLARSRRGLVAWDWEYSEPGAPVGLDEVHSVYQQRRNVEGDSVATALSAAHTSTTDPWLADAHLAMLVTRHALLRELAATEVGDHREVFAAARVRLRRLDSKSSHR